jgi:hypothetical protein
MSRFISIAPERETILERLVKEPSTPTPIAVVMPQVDIEPSEAATHPDVLAPFLRREDDQRHRDERRTLGEVPWLSTVKLPWGPEVSLLNISRTGMLVETTFKFTPGNLTEFQLCGPEVNLVVRARFVRSEVAAVDSRSVKYHAAAVFSEELRLQTFLGRGNLFSPPKALAELLTHVVADLDRYGQGGLRSRFEQGLRKLVVARDIQIRDGVVSPTDTSESIYFTVPSTLGTRAILQVTFEPGHELLEMEFRLLQSAATLAAVILEFEKMPLDGRPLLREAAGS